MAINPNAYCTIQAFMVTDLQLKGNALIAYAIIYGFSQDGKTEFAGSLNYLMEWLGCSRPTIIKTLNELIDKGLITKRVTPDGITPNAYMARPLMGSKETLPGVVKNFNEGSKETLPGVVKNFNEGSKETLHNNYLDNYINNNLDKESVKTPSVPYEEIKDLFNKTCKSYSRVTALSNERKKAIKARFEQYGIVEIEAAFIIAENSKFLKGYNERGWRANFDWIMKDANFVKIIDGNYGGIGEDLEDDFVLRARLNPPTIDDEDDLLQKSKHKAPVFKKGANGVLVDKSIDNSDLPWEIGG